MAVTLNPHNEPDAGKSQTRQNGCV